MLHICYSAAIAISTTLSTMCALYLLFFCVFGIFFLLSKACRQLDIESLSITFLSNEDRPWSESHISSAYSGLPGEVDINVDVIYGTNKIFASHQNMLPRSSKTMHTGRYCCSLWSAHEWNIADGENSNIQDFGWEKLGFWVWCLDGFRRGRGKWPDCSVARLITDYWRV